MDYAPLERRIASLERQCSILRAVVALFLTGLCAFVACGKGVGGGVIEARAFILKDADGAVRGEWAPSGELLPSEGGEGRMASLTCLRFLDRKGQLAFHSCGRWDEGASSSVLVSDSTGARVSMLVDPEGASLRVGNQRTAERPRMPHVSLAADGESAHLMVGPGGPHAAVLTVDELMMRDERGHVFVRLPERERATPP